MMPVEILISISLNSKRLAIDNAFRLGGENHCSRRSTRRRAIYKNSSFKVASATHYEKKDLICIV